MNWEEEIVRLEAEKAHLERDRGKYIGTEANEFHNKRIGEVHHRLNSLRSAVRADRARMSEAELRDRLRPPPSPPEPLPELDAHGRPIPKPVPIPRSAREQFETLKAENPILAAQFAARYETDIFGR